LGSRRSLFSLLRRKQHYHLAAFNARALIDYRHVFQVGFDPIKQLQTKILVSHLAAAEAKRDLGLVAVFEEAAQVAQLDLIVAFLGAGPEFDFLDLDLLLLLARCLLLFLQLEAMLAVIHDPTNGGRRVGIDLYEVELRRFGASNRVIKADYADLLTFLIDEPDAIRLNFTVEPSLVTRRAGTSLSWS
jgi:hypothetical protein